MKLLYYRDIVYIVHIVCVKNENCMVNERVLKGKA